jgi:hypothetical protein
MHIANVLVSLYCFTSATRERKQPTLCSAAVFAALSLFLWSTIAGVVATVLWPTVSCASAYRNGLGEPLHPSERHLICRNAVAIVRKHFGDASRRLFRHI